MNINLNDYQDLIGKQYVFEDGNSITVTQIKMRDDNIPWVTYNTVSGPGIPRRYTMILPEFNSHYGHLFKLENNNPNE